MLQSNLTENGYYEIEEDEETGKFKPVIIQNWQQGDDYDFRVNVNPTFDSTNINENGSYSMVEGNMGWKPQLVSNPDISQEYDIEVNVNPTFESTTINGNGFYNMVKRDNGWKPELVSNPDLLETYDLNIQVPQTINPLETLTNKRLQSEQTYTISNLMQDPTNNEGITKNSTIIVDIPDYPPTTTQKQLTLTENTSSSQTIYPPSGEYWDSIRYSVSVNVKINRFYISTNYETLTNFTTYSNAISNFIINSHEAVVRIVESGTSYTVNLLVNNDTSNKSITLPYDSGKVNKYVKFGTTNGSSILKLCYNNNSSIIEINDESLDVNFSYVTLSKNTFIIQ